MTKIPIWVDMGVLRQLVPSTTRSQLAAEYLESCRRHSTAPIDTVLRQIRELPENAIGGGGRAARLTLANCSLGGAAPADALEALLRRARFHRLELHHAHIDDEAAEALFDMIEYYESAVTLSINGPRAFGIRGWQAASRMIKRSCQLSELELSNHPLESNHAPVLARALHAHTCRLRVLCLQHCSLTGDPLLCLVIALKSNSSVRELRLGDNRLGVHDAAQLASLLRLNTLLELLDLSNNQIQDAGCGHIADALCEQAAHTPTSAAASPLSPQRYMLGGSISSYDARGLAFLVLWNNQLTRNCAHHLSRALQSQSLCVLNVGRNALGTETVRALGRCSTGGGGPGSGGGALVSLGLQAARLGPDAAKPLADLIVNTSLQRLDLRDNKLGAVGLEAILNAMRESNTLTQIDLDEPTESTTTLTDASEETEGVAVARLTREIRALCCDKEPVCVPPDQTARLHRKISLTCHTMPVVHTVHSPSSPCGLRVTGPPGAGLNSGNARDREAERRGTRLRSPLPSPAPSPAGSPVPPQHSRFSVTRVTPERELSSSSSTSSLPSYSTSPSYGTSPVSSRFKVVQVRLKRVSTVMPWEL
ncbi:hypothetical protein O0L34_g15826 [Tuta absoluta]|nr:hypothetical protein O0L34_g15826 [Tuta absoluta]